MLKHPDAKLDSKIVYSHLENALFQGLMGCIKTQALLADVRVRMMQRGNMDGAIGYFYTGLGNGEVVVI